VEKTAPTKHRAYLDGLRGLAALFVVFHHAYLQVIERDNLSGLAARLTQILLYGHYAVDLFIVLSGFCLMLPVVNSEGGVRGGALNFFRRRAWRILPPYYLAMAFSTLLAFFVIDQKTGTHWDISIPVTTKSIVTHLALLHDVFGEDFTINHVFWSIAVEWRIYFLFPLLVWAWRRWGGFKTTAVAILVSYSVQFLCGELGWPSLTVYYIGLFAIGMLGCSIAFSPFYIRLRNLPWGWGFGLTTLLVIFGAKAKVWQGGLLPISLQDLFVGLWSMALLILLSTRESGWIYNFVSYKPIVFLGTFAYSIYLIHAPIIQILWQYVFTPLQDKPVQMLLALSLIGILPILALSYLFFILCERPFIHKKKDVPLAVRS
jgi:peptidoglycan/LPS O-acetylase OafA/YrhL